MNIDPREYSELVDKGENLARLLGRTQAHLDQQTAHIREQGETLKLAQETTAAQQDLIRQQSATLDRLTAIGDQQAVLLRRLQAVMAAAVQLRAMVIAKHGSAARPVVAKLDEAIAGLGDA